MGAVAVSWIFGWGVIGKGFLNRMCIFVDTCHVLIHIRFASSVFSLFDSPIHVDERAEVDMSLHSAILPGFLRAAGEEIGWRCYLLPCLLQNYSVFHALLLRYVFKC